MVQHFTRVAGSSVAGKVTSSKTSLLAVVLSGIPALFDVSRAFSAVGVILLTAIPLLSLWVSNRNIPSANPIFVLDFVYVLPYFLIKPNLPRPGNPLRTGDLQCLPLFKTRLTLHPQ
jgi:hypothetical protein